MKRDLYSRAVWDNGAWKGKYRLPGKTERFVLNEDGKTHKTFPSQYEAAQGAADHKDWILRDKTTGFFSEPIKSDLNAVKVFENFK